MSAPFKLSVVVPTYNRCEVLISRSLPTLFNQDCARDDYEVIVAVDGSTDGTAVRVRKLDPPCALQILELPRRGPAATRNQGIHAARGELVLFVDDDVLCAPDVVRRHIEAHAGGGPCVVHGSISIAPDTPPSVMKYSNAAWYKAYYGRLDRQGGLLWPKDDFLISNSSIPRSTLLACGDCDESFSAKEDYELGLRLWQMGVPFRYVPEARMQEFFIKGSQYVLRYDGECFGKTEVMLSRKHPVYRPYSGFAGLGRLSWRKRLRQQIYVRLPFSLAGLMAAPLWVCEKLCRFPAFQRAGNRLLGAGRSVVEYRSAAREAGSWHKLVSEFGRRLPVLLYHHVGQRRPGAPPGLTVAPEKFARQIRWLARRGYTGIRAADWAAWLRTGQPLPRKPVLLTFDDAYADLVEYALPVLRRYGFAAVVYVVTGEVGRTNAWVEAQGYTGLRLMTADQIRTWARQGIEFGAHSRTHADLTKLGPAEVEQEVLGSRDDLANLLGERVVSFAYPYGPYNQNALDCARRGFDLAFTVDRVSKGMNYLDSDPHSLQRIMVLPGDTVLDVLSRARWGHSPLMDLRHRLILRSRWKRTARSVFGGSKP